MEVTSYDGLGAYEIIVQLNWLNWMTAVPKIVYIEECGA
jgi:hypothetical protein